MVIIYFFLWKSERRAREMVKDINFFVMYFFLLYFFLYIDMVFIVRKNHMIALYFLLDYAWFSTKSNNVTNDRVIYLRKKQKKRKYSSCMYNLQKQWPEKTWKNTKEKTVLNPLFTPRDMTNEFTKFKTSIFFFQSLKVKSLQTSLRVLCSPWNPTSLNPDRTHSHTDTSS